MNGAKPRAQTIQFQSERWCGIGREVRELTDGNLLFDARPVLDAMRVILGSSSTWPLVGRSSVPLMWSKVLLPEPNGPTMASDEPASTSNDTSSSTVSEPGPSGVSK